MSDAATIRRLTPQMRQALVVAVAILVALGSILVVFPKDTDRFFSWPIAPPLTASALAACYYTGSLVLLLAMRGWVWAPVKVVLPGGIIFSALATLATFLHFGKFNFGSEVPTGRAIAWIWLIAYLILPPLLLAFWPAQSRAPGDDPPAKPPPRWLRAALLAIGATLVVGGMLLFVAPEATDDVWPWALTPLTAKVLSAWFTGLGVVFATAAVSDDRMRMRAPTVGVMAFGVLQGVALLRHGSDASGIGLGVWAAFLGICVLVGLAGTRAVWAHDPARLGRPA